MLVPALASRAEGLERLAQFVPRAGDRYARTRNFDFGPDNRANVSGLSPWIRLRLLCESEVIAAAVAVHGAKGARKFVEEVCWRTYFKGWLELRSVVWSDYRRALGRLRDDLDTDPALRRAWRRATAGETGIDCFDAWVGELIEHGYLHNHARMWFASIWIFTLGLPWQLGADLFLRHLLDGDPASNTLSWRWVAGLHTRGRTYRARRDNIRRYTDGRFDPGPRLTDDTPAPDEPPLPRPARLEALAPPPRAKPLTLLLTDDDLNPESLGLPADRVAFVTAVSSAAQRSVFGTATGAVEFAQAGLGDALRRSAEHFGATIAPECPSPADVDSLADQAAAAGPRDVVLAWPPVGPGRELAERVVPALRARGLDIWPIRRHWDDALWPAAGGGYFGFRKKAMPRALELAAADAPVGINRSRQSAGGAGGRAGTGR
jgi:deoxyribodipyrimidine photo-lyase